MRPCPNPNCQKDWFERHAVGGFEFGYCQHCSFEDKVIHFPLPPQKTGYEKDPPRQKRLPSPPPLPTKKPSKGKDKHWTKI